MGSDRANGRLILWITVLIALLLQVMPLPPMVAAARPDWVLLVICYWVLALPHRFNIFSACLVGVVLDILLGGTLGIRGLAFAVAAYLVALQYQKLRHFAVIQQMLVVASLSLLTHLVLYWAEFVANPEITMEWFYLQPVLVTPLLWPWVFWLLRRTRRRYKIR